MILYFSWLKSTKRSFFRGSFWNLFSPRFLNFKNSLRSDNSKFFTETSETDSKNFAKKEANLETFFGRRISGFGGAMV